MVSFYRADWNGQQLTAEDINLLCDLFYLPFEHGTQGIQLLQEFYWLHTNAHLASASIAKPEVTFPSFFKLKLC